MSEANTNPMHNDPILLVGISGPSSSGKTTVSRLLRDIFPHQQLSILHLDDFYVTDNEIPVKDGIQDWDCIGSLNLPSLCSTLSYIKENGKIPSDFVSKEDQNDVGKHAVAEDEMENLKQQVQTLLDKCTWTRRICIVDGFLLFSEEMKKIRTLFDVKLFLRVRYETVKSRREARKGYVTMEGFWEDPPGYVDKIVWPNYVQDHKFLFNGEDVEGELNEYVCQSIGVKGMPRDAQEDMGKCLKWVVDVLTNVILLDSTTPEVTTQ